MQKEEEREKNFFQFWKDIPYELKIQKETDSYDKIMEVHPKYPYIWYKLGLIYDSIGYKQKAKEYFHRMETTKGYNYTINESKIGSINLRDYYLLLY